MANKIPPAPGSNDPPANADTQPSGPPGAGRPAGYNGLAPELREKIAVHLKGRDRLNFALASKRNLAAIAPQLDGARLAAQAERIAGLAAFRALLGDESGHGEAIPKTIGGLRHDLQAEPLLALAPRIMAVPLHHQAAAAESWREAAERAHRLDAENPVLPAERMRQDQSKALSNEVMHVNGLAQFHALLGSSADRPDANREAIRSLRADLRVKPLMALASRIAALPEDEWAAAARSFLSAAADIPQAYRVGLATLEDKARDPAAVNELHINELHINELRIAACVNAVKSGETVQDVLDRSGAAGPRMTEHLTAIAWGTAVKNGMAIEDAASSYGLAEPDRLDRARMIAATDDIHGGETVDTVAIRYSITGAAAIAELIHTADLVAEANARNDDADPNRHDASGLASIALQICKALVLGGMSVQAVATRYCLADDDELAELGATATDAAAAHIRNGESVQAAAERYGITHPEHIARLEQVASATAASLSASASSSSNPPPAATSPLKAKL